MPNSIQEFPATRWSLISQVRTGSEAEAGAALDKLCHTYWRPLYAFARWWGAPPETAPDLVQGFLSSFIERGDLIRSSPEKGRFRAFLLAAFKNHLISARRREQAEKRGGGLIFVALEDACGEEKWRAAIEQEIGPEEAYDRRWAEEVMIQAMAQVENDYRRAGNETVFAVLKPALTGGGDDFASLGSRIGLSAGGARSAMHRMRQKLREALRGEIAQTVATPQDLEDEMRYLLGLLAR
ncbi:MAG TPA: sigma-70 family RNA polymerase sigma factor [Verrucomicrobiales bacterium]|nr:sigma-70 family RNA polymerase sigma factor [Verrucomicrobiales bacterium]